MTTVTGALVELRIEDGRAVVDGDDGRPELSAELNAALQEWARVAAALRAATDSGSAAQVDLGPETAGLVSRRGQQLAVRVATELREPVRLTDPITDATTVVEPPSAAERPPAKAAAEDPDSWTSRTFRRTPGEPTPWVTGLIVSAFSAAVVLVGMMALITTLTESTNGLVAAIAAAVVCGGMAPSLWLGRTVPTVRWVCLGASAGLIASWVGLLALVF